MLRRITYVLPDLTMQRVTPEVNSTGEVRRKSTLLLSVRRKSSPLQRVMPEVTSTNVSEQRMS
jgi:hypothetical protein